MTNTNKHDSSSWPEQDAIDKWLGSLGLSKKIKFADVLELKKAVTAIRVSYCDAVRAEFDPMPDSLTRDEPRTDTQELTSKVPYQRGAASRDGEVERLTSNSAVSERRLSESIAEIDQLRQERDELAAHIELLQSIRKQWGGLAFNDGKVLISFIEAMAQSSSTSLQQHDNEVIEKCTKYGLEQLKHMSPTLAVKAIRALKTGESDEC